MSDRPPPPPPLPPPPSSRSGPPPDWYLFDGHQRWWDGSAWGPYAPPMVAGSLPRDVGRRITVLCHAGALVAPLLVALIVWATAGRRSAFARHHAAAAFNFQLTIITVGVANYVLGLRLLPATGGAWVITTVPVYLWLVGSVVGYSVVAAQSARQGEWYRYPMSIRLVGGEREQP